MFAFFVALQLVDGSFFAVFQLLLPLLIYNMGVYFLHEKWDRHLFIGSVVSLVGSGIALYSTGDFGSTTNIFAYILIFVNVIADAVSTLLTKKLSSELSLEQLNGLTHATNFIFFSVLTMVFWSHIDISSITVASWAGAAWATIMSTIVAIRIYLIALKKLNMTEMSLFVYISPIVGIAASIIILNESRNLLFWVGASIVVLGIAYAERIMKLRVPNLFKHRIHFHQVVPMLDLMNLLIFDTM